MPSWATERQLIVNSALVSTIASFTNNWKKAIFFLVIATGANYWRHSLFGPPNSAGVATMNWVLEWIAVVAIPSVVFVLVVFTWNLWLTPARLIKQDMSHTAHKLSEVEGRLSLLGETLEAKSKIIDTLRHEKANNVDYLETNELVKAWDVKFTHYSGVAARQDGRIDDWTRNQAKCAMERAREQDSAITSCRMDVDCLRREIPVFKDFVEDRLKGESDGLQESLKQIRSEILDLHGRMDKI